jgi:hypothetical protein
MLFKLGIIVFIVLASTVLALVGALVLPPEIARGVPLLIPLVAFAGMAWLIYDGKQRAPSNVRFAPIAVLLHHHA